MIKTLPQNYLQIVQNVIVKGSSSPNCFEIAPKKKQIEQKNY